jgi:hypothetical protein
VVKQLTAAIVDIKALTEGMERMWKEEISMMLPEMGGGDGDVRAEGDFF